MIEALGVVLGALLVGMVLLLLIYDALFKPWKFVKAELDDIKK